MNTTGDSQKTGLATYSPEDNKLRLYVGRVPRDEYERLRAEGWTSTPKQNCDFVATWTPQRRNTALEYADIIEDEDMGPAERAADRAERFGEYRDKRTSEATGHADRYDSDPSAHGYQSQTRADRAARRHDRIAGHAVDAWSKAEYWQQRTAGVIGHALYVSTPGVRMGRIKTLEAELRKHEAEVKQRTAVFRNWQKIAAIADPVRQTSVARQYAGSVHAWAEYMHPRAEALSGYGHDHELSLYSLLSHDTDPITGAEAVALYFSDHSEPEVDDDWSLHYKLRLAYENQMLEAQGGRAAFVEMEVGGWIGGYQIRKVNKSNATGRVVSVNVIDPKGWSGFTRESGYKEHVTRAALVTLNIERLSVSSYRPPTPEDIASLEATVKAEKAKQPKKAPCPLINPTDADAERLQAIWNERAKDQYQRESKYNHADFKPAAVVRSTQAQYSASSKGAYGSAETRGVSGDAELGDKDTDMYSREREDRRKRIGPAVCEVRVTSGGTHQWPYVSSVIVLTDKSQKSLPQAVWEKYTAPVVAELVSA